LAGKALGGTLSAFFEAHFIYIYFFYGLAFFSMGLALMVESRRASRLSLVRAVRWLAVFGILHGSHEFVEMFVLISGRNLPLWADALRIGLLATSFVPLLIFGVQLLPRSDHDPHFAARMILLGAITYITAVILAYVTYNPTVSDWLRAVDTLARYMMAVPGALLAGIALVRQRRFLDEEGMARYGRDLVWAAMALFWYGVVGQAFPNSSYIFPSMYINTGTFWQLFGIPVQLFRGCMAAVLAVFMIRALRAFEEETRGRLEVARQVEHELQTAARELSLLYEASSLLASTSDLATLMHDAIDRVVSIIEPIKSGMIFVLGDENTEDHIAAYGYQGDMHRRLESFDLPVFAWRGGGASRQYWIDEHGQDVSDSIWPPSSLSPPDEPVFLQRVALPLVIRGRVVGGVLLETAPGGPYLSAAEAPTIVALARQIASAVENAQLVLQLRQREALRSELLQHTTAAQEAERKRIARELHDETGQALTALAMGLRGAVKMIDRAPKKAANHITELQEISTHALDELRHLITDLRPSHLDDLGLVAALRWYTEQLARRTNMAIEFRVIGNERRLSPETETSLFRIAQEGLTNAVRHAGATHTKLCLAFDETAVNLAIHDDGRGFDPGSVLRTGPGRAWGLIGIQERATLAGGNLLIDSEPGWGTVILVTVPMLPFENTPLNTTEEATDDSD
jgi:signal transduction histidine kinase